MSNLRSDARAWIERSRLEPGDPASVYVGRLCNQVDEVEELWHKAERRDTLKRFQAWNVARCLEAFGHELDAWTLLEWAGALAGEVGELANVCKKLRRKEAGIGGSWAKRDPAVQVLEQQLKDEAGDVLAYLVLLASAAGFDLYEAAAHKFDQVSEVAGWRGVRLVKDEDLEGEVDLVKGGEDNLWLNGVACINPTDDFLRQFGRTVVDKVKGQRPGKATRLRLVQS